MDRTAIMITTMIMIMVHNKDISRLCPVHLNLKRWLWLPS